MKKHLMSLLFLSASLMAQETQDLQPFAFSLYSQIDEPDINSVFSPYSIFSSLSLLYMGARGETANQIRSALQLTVPKEELPKLFSAPHDSFKVANGVWVDQDTAILTNFRYEIEEEFKAGWAAVDFSQKEKALEKINGWTSKNTEGKIPQLLDANDISASTKLIITNALLFQGSFASPFNPKKTKSNSDFFPTPESTSKVSMMKQTETFPYFENDLFQGILFPFDKKDVALLIILPESQENLRVILKEARTHLNEWIDQLTQERVEVHFPKFTLSTRYDLSTALRNLGMKDAFTTQADFLGIDGIGDLTLNKVVHEAYFELNENGLLATAATAAIMKMKSTPLQKEIKLFIADHPFLFFLVNLPSKEILFMGTYRNADQN